MAADHVGLDQLLVGVVADLIRRAVGDLEVDAVALVDPEEERFGFLLAGHDRRDVLVGHHDPTLEVDPLRLVVDDGDLDHRRAVRDGARFGGARIDDGGARERSLGGIHRLAGDVRRIVELPRGVLFLRELECDARDVGVRRVETLLRLHRDRSRRRGGGLVGGRERRVGDRVSAWRGARWS